MNVKIKAETIYKNSMFVHGPEKAKDEALKTAETVKCLVPIQDQKFCKLDRSPWRWHTMLKYKFYYKK